MNSYLYSPVVETVLSCRGSVSVAGNSYSLDDTSFLDATISPIRLIKDDGTSQKISEISCDAIIEQENSQSLLGIALKKKEDQHGIFDTVDDFPETPKSVETIDLTTPKKASQNRSPLLPTQPPPATCSTLMQRRSRARFNGTLDSWINWFEPPAKPKPVDADKYASWLNISPDVSPKKLDPVNLRMTVDGSYSSQISSGSLTISTEIRPTFPNYNSRKLRRLTSNITERRDEKISKFLQTSPQIFSRSSTNQISERVAEVQNSSMVLKSILAVTPTSQKETSEDQLDVISSQSDNSTLPLTPSPPNTSRKTEMLKEVSFTTMLNRSNVAGCYAVLESQHTRSLMNVISSPTFCRNEQKYVDNKLTSRFNDNGKVRRKKAERRLLHGYDCRCCADYYEALGLNQDERNKRIDQVS